MLKKKVGALSDYIQSRHHAFTRRNTVPTSNHHKKRNNNTMPSKATSTALKSLHIPGTPILFTNVWDTISARAIAPLPSCKALATASYAIAIAANTTDDALTYEENLQGIRAIAKVAQQHDKPLTADIQDGYGDRLEEAIGALLDLDVAGCNLEDYDNANQRMYPEAEAAARVERTMEVARKRGEADFVVSTLR